MEGRLRYLTLCALALAAPIAPAVAAPAIKAAAAPAAFQQLLAADRAFSEQGRGKSLPDALGAMFDSDAVLVAGGSPDLIRGADAIRANLSARPDNATATVDWTPIGGGMSADGTHGFTYGSMTVRPKEGDSRPLKYLAYWVKRAEGWRVAGYKRVGMRAAMALPPGGSVIGSGPKRADDGGATLKAAEGAFSAEAQRIGLRAAFQKWGRPESVNIGGPDGIAVGAQAIGEAVAGPETSSPLTWGADQVLVAPSGDMGLSYGLLHITHPQAGRPATAPFFTIWARPRPGDPWRYIAE